MRTLFAVLALCLGLACTASAGSPESAAVNERQQGLIREAVELNLMDESYDIVAGTMQLVIDLKAEFPEINLDNAIIPLMGILKSSECPNLRIMASVALMQFDSEKALYAVCRRALYDPDPRVAKHCCSIARELRSRGTGRVIAAVSVD